MEFLVEMLDILVDLRVKIKITLVVVGEELPVDTDLDLAAVVEHVEENLD